jgi:oxalate decarboxylase/phosphoglucose isomerase-like protein (cupin superfamily)
MSVEILELSSQGDERGVSFSDQMWKTFLQRVKDIHIATIRPGAVRGNHYHRERREVLFVMYFDDWSFHWEAEAGGSFLQRRFRGSGCVTITVEPEISHAVRNDGRVDLFMVGVSDANYDPRKPDAYRREVIAKTGSG